MSDLVPMPDSNGPIRVVKLMNGDELVAIVQDVSFEKLIMVYPAKIEALYSRDENNNLVEYVKLTNYATNMDKSEFLMNKSGILCIGNPTKELQKMYETYCVAIQSDPLGYLQNGGGETVVGPEAGIQMLNELFNNEDFVNFVNDLIDNFEGVEVGFEDTEDEEIESEALESATDDTAEEEAPKPPKAKKRRTMKPEANKMPYEPNGNPDNPESWSDNPSDYI